MHASDTDDRIGGARIRRRWWAGAGIAPALQSCVMTQDASTPIYLDHNATTYPWPEVVERMESASRELWANPSSVHRFGQRVRHEVELARESVCGLINCDPAELVFTSGGTESTNLAIHGTLDRLRRTGFKRQVIMTSTVEHSAVREPIDEAEETPEFTIIRIGVDRNGSIKLDDYETAVRNHAGRIGLISIQWANNETGVIQPLERLVAIAKEADARAVFHTDAIQWVGKVATDVQTIAVDLMSFAGHKFHGPLGAGGLFVRRGLRIRPQQRGGPHERERRGGTENVPAILGLGVAAELARKRLDDGQLIERTRTLRDAFETRILDEIAGTSINGRDARDGRLWNTTNIAFDRIEAEAILIGLSERGLCASAGAACSSGSLDPSPVLLAMGIPETQAHGSIRFSLSENTTPDETDEAVKIIKPVVERLSELLPTVD